MKTQLIRTLGLIIGLVAVLGMASIAAGQPLSDQQITRQLVDRLAKNDAFQNVLVAVQEHVVRLSGTVPSLWPKTEAIDKARESTSLRSVVSDALTIESAESDEAIAEEIAHDMRRVTIPGPSAAARPGVSTAPGIAASRLPPGGFNRPGAGFGRHGFGIGDGRHGFGIGDGRHGFGIGDGRHGFGIGDGQLQRQLHEALYPGFPFCLPRMASLYIREPPSARNFVRRTIVQLQRPSPQPALTCDRLEPLLSGHFSDTAPHLCSFFSMRDFIALVARQPAGTGSAQILRSMSPNSRPVRCPSASRSQ